MDTALTSCENGLTLHFTAGGMFVAAMVIVVVLVLVLSFAYAFSKN